MSGKDKNRIVKQHNRLIIKREWQGQGIWVRFADSESDIVYEYPHDEFIKELEKRNPEIFETDSWNGDKRWFHWPSLTKRGKYSWFRDWLKPYCVQESAADPGTEEERPIAPRTDTRSVEPAPLKSESDAYLQAVRDWRNYWRPEKINVLLIAESHVHEMDGDDQTEVVSLEEYGLQGHPEVFCRLIHCLGYGEQDLLTSEVTSNGGGTWQFWDIFGAIACCDIDHPDSKQPRKGKSDLAERVRWKVKTLEALKNRGIWLIDACPYGVYEPGGSRREIPNDEFRRLFLEEVLSEIDTGNLRSSWIIGKTVHDKIADLAPLLKGYVVQPQGWRQSWPKYLEHLLPMIQDIADEVVK